MCVLGSLVVSRRKHLEVFPIEWRSGNVSPSRTEGTVETVIRLSSLWKNYVLFVSTSNLDMEISPLHSLNASRPPELRLTSGPDQRVLSRAFVYVPAWYVFCIYEALQSALDPDVEGLLGDSGNFDFGFLRRSATAEETFNYPRDVRHRALDARER